MTNEFESHIKMLEQVVKRLDESRQGNGGSDGVDVAAAQQALDELRQDVSKVKAQVSSGQVSVGRHHFSSHEALAAWCNKLNQAPTYLDWIVDPFSMLEHARQGTDAWEDSMKQDPEVVY